MKGAAKCSKHCDLQNSVNQWYFERVSRFWDIPGSLPVSVLCSCLLSHLWDCLCQDVLSINVDTCVTVSF